MSELTILVVGNTQRAEFREALASLEQKGRLETVTNIDAAAKILSEGGFAPDLVVVAQAFPGEFSSEALDRLRRLAPLARVLGLLGTWCEGETRTGKPWPAAIRVYWHQWPTRAERELSQLSEGVSSSWALPLTAGEEERFLALAEKPLEPRDGLIGIATPQWDMYDWLAGACQSCGYATQWLRPPYEPSDEGIRAVVFDTTGSLDEQLAPLRQLAGRLRAIPIVALVDFPRVEDRQRALEAGAASVLSKPLLVEDLFWQLDRALTPDS